MIDSIQFNFIFSHVQRDSMQYIKNNKHHITKEGWVAENSFWGTPLFMGGGVGGVGDVDLPPPPLYEERKEGRIAYKCGSPLFW